MEKIRLLIDTDIGGDIDDALALAMALNSPQIDLLGVTTVYAASQWRTDLVKEMLRVWGREDVPVRRGAERPILGRFPHDTGAGPLVNEAVPFIIETCRNNPGCVLLGIGPLTNIALALAIAPEIAGTTRFVFMGGMLKCAQPEWNIQCDPEAAKIVFDLVPLRLIGLDITEQCRLSREEAEQLTQGDDPRLRFLKGEFDRFFSHFTFLPTLHDPLALASLLWDDLITWEDLAIRVETAGSLTRGTTVQMRQEQQGKVLWGREVVAAEAVKRMKARIRGEA
ncbi:MAG: nucleoside hydrolase [Christensenellales bacterium]